MRLLKESGEFLSMDEVRLGTDMNNIILNATLSNLVRKGEIIRVYVDSKPFYGLPEFLK